MAAEIPVCDVLCEAMEYLSKLGTNLRTRSENLKDKRIRKDKLRNTHAIQKAAEKVLLICELSKKSLENVETGVRNVLSLVDASQAPSNVGGKNADKKIRPSKPNFYVFEHESCKLRISKKISLKHYKSVKVLAKSMPASMQDKYPVFYDCKLRQKRIREEKRNSDRKNDETEDSDNNKSHGDREVVEVHDIDSDSGDRQEKSKSSYDNNKRTKHGIKSQNSEKEINSCSSPEHENLKSHNLQEEQHIDDNTESNQKSLDIAEKDDKIIDLEDEHNSILKTSKTEDSSKKIKLDKIGKNKDSRSSTELDENSHKKRSETEKENQSSSDEDNKKSKEKSPSKKGKSKSTDKSNNASECNSDSNNSDCGSKEQQDESKPKIRCVNITKLLKPDVIGKCVDEIDRKKLKKDKHTGKLKSNNDVFAKKSSEAKLSKDKKYDDDVQKRKEAKLSKQRTYSISDDDDNEFWEQKRNEVKQFKPKKITVNIEKLHFTNEFLLKHKLNRITKGGKTVFEATQDTENGIKQLPEKISKVKNALLEDSDNSDESNSNFKQTDKSEKRKKTIDRNAESDKSDSEIGNNRDNHSDTDRTNLETSKNTDRNSKTTNRDAGKDKSDSEKHKSNGNLENRDNHSDSERNNFENAEKNTSNLSSIAERNPESLTEINSERESDSGNAQSNNQNNQIVDPEAVKNALLNDSDSDTNKNDEKPVEKEKNCFDSSPISLEELQACVDETIKKALLMDSDSDKQNKNNSETDNITTKEHSNANNTSQSNEKENIQSNSKEQEESMQDPEQIKSHLLNESSDSDSHTEIDKTEIKKRRHAIRSKRAKKMLLQYSSSENEKEEKRGSESESRPKKRKRKHSSRKLSSSSSSEQESKKKKNRRESSSSDKGKEKKCSEDNEELDSSVSKMVRSKSKPSGSSGQNSDNQDASDKDIDGLTNLNSLHKTHRRRRDSPSTNDAESRSSSKKTSKLKAKPIIGEDLLHEMSSSDPSDDDHGVEEDLPPLSVTGLNGDSVTHLAKDDLLGDSDSSATQDKEQNEESPNAEHSEEESVKQKRRKANTISSDSEGGSSRRKKVDEDVRVSDFEDSEEESSEPTKRTKRKKKGSDSDASAGSSNDGGQKKRRRIKQLKDSDNSGSDTENEGRNKHGRKNIRKVMGKNQLEEATKKAAREEKERIARIAERQKLYNNLDFDESGKPDEVVLEKVVLDFDPETKEPLIEVDRGLVKKLKPHQANGIKFMWDACFESVKRIKKDRGSGCILAHCMGLGKTLQVISLTHTLLTHGELTGVNRVLVVCPLSTVLNWVNEIRMWLKHAHSDYEVDIYELSRYKQNSERAFQLQQWFEGGGVCVLGYEMFRNLSADNTKKFKKKMLKSFQEALVDPGPDLVVCDEGHLLKNEKTSLSQSMNRIKTLRRIVLTGTPLQNNLKEYYCMVQFVKPNLLGKYNEYLNRFVNPITNGQYTDSTEHDIRVMKRRSHVLHKMLDGAVQRRDYGVLAPFLPPKHEYVLFITLTDVQVKLYQHYLDNYSRRPLPGKSSGFLFPDFQSLQRIWTHPLVLKYNSERFEIMQQKKREREEEEESEGSLADFIDDNSTPEETTTEESTDDSSDMSDDSRKKNKKKKKALKNKAKEAKASTRRGTRANPVEVDEDPDVSEVIEVKNENPTEWWIKLVEEEELEDMRNSHKLVLLFNILRQCEAIGDKLLVFSQSLYSLDLIEHFLGKVDEATQEGRIDEKLGGHVGSWAPGVDYFRLDGSTSCENRSIWCKNFNREDNPRARLFLISTRAGGLGINLVAANRVVIFDVSWNPSHDVQSIFRVYRFGQKKPCYIYRFLAMGTMEEKIYERQVTKQAISKRVIDEQQIDRHYAENDLAELYKFDPRPLEPRPLPTLPKDRLFAEMLKEHEAQIYKYHEHDSLLENKEEETLSEEERKAAWEDFENEKNKPPPTPFTWPMHNGMGGVPGLFVQQQQQQQFAMAAMISMLRKEMPNITDAQLRDMLPVIYNANPGLMQKISEMYPPKYPQAGMMNPGMMNAVMNPGSGSVGGSSGLQYEPPWQRQHQQQQQLRLQQLMQQQNQMGAKFYAGGLGSRDPVAMALQQQRAREIMMGGSATGRPRGRPPLAPRAPPMPTTTNDVVNLDSD